jgi:hypothetical protein
MRAFVLLVHAALLVSIGLAHAEPPRVEYRPGGPQFQKVWDAFYRNAFYEPEISIPLEKASKDMTPAICEAVRHPDMKRRRYAIIALGFRRDKRALQTLENILNDEKEIYYFRGDALEAVNEINNELGKHYAIKFAGDHPYLKRISNWILNHGHGPVYLYERFPDERDFINGK